MMSPPLLVNSLIADCMAAGKILYFPADPLAPARVVTCSPQIMSAAINLRTEVLSLLELPYSVLSEEKASALAEQNGYPAAIMALPWT